MINKLTIIALPGNGGGAFRFERVKPYIPIGVSFKAITLPGFAGVPRDLALQSLRDYAAYLHSLLTLEPRPLVLLGHGIGGALALEYGQYYAAQLDGLILHAPVGTRLESRFLPRLMALPGARPLGQWLFAARPLRPLFKRLLFSQPVPSDYLERFFDEYRRCSVFGQMFELITPAWFRSLHPVDIPTALLWGERERILTVDQWHDYQSLFPRHLIQTVPAWDHFPMIEQPEAYAHEIVGLGRRLLESD